MTNSPDAILQGGRMFLKKELDQMEVPYIEGSIFLNIGSSNDEFPHVDNEVRKHMRIVNYTDFSETEFSDKLLVKSISGQIAGNANIIWLSRPQP